MIKAVIFDIDGVLLDSVKANYKYFSEIFHSLGKDIPSFEIYKDKYYHMPSKEILRHFFGFEPKELETNFQESKKTTYHWEMVKIVNGVKKTIKKLSQKYKLAIVSGRFSVESTLDYLGFDKSVWVIVKFGDYKNPKPDPEPVLIALKKLRVNPNEAVYIGDQLVDLQSAKTAGCKFITFSGVSGKRFKDEDANTEKFNNLPELIENLNH